jgi:ankyrin repeat protein
MYDSTENLSKIPNEVQHWFTAIVRSDLDAIRSAHANGLPIETIHPIRQTTALVEASRRGLDTVVGLLLDLGAAPDLLCGRKQTTAMHTAIRGQHFSIAFQLLPAMKSFTQCDSAGNSYLHVLNEHYQRPELQAEALRLAEALIAGGTPLNAINEEGVAALHYAVVHDWELMAELLLMRGADVNITAAESGASALIMAALDDNLPLIRLLFEYDADPRITMDCGKTVANILPRVIDEAPEKIRAQIIEIVEKTPPAKTSSTASAQKKA